MKRYLMPTAFSATALLSTTIRFASVVFIVLAAVGGGPQAWAQCPSPAYTPDFSLNQNCLTLNSYSYTDGLGTGSTEFTGNNPVVLQLTANSGNQTGSAWYTNPQVVQNGFTTNFQFQLTPAGGADGIAFVIQNAGTSAIGFTGGNGGALDVFGVTSSGEIEAITAGIRGERLE